MLKFTLAAVLLATLTGVVQTGAALAEGCHDEAKMSCAADMTWDTKTQTCTAKPSS